MDASWLYKAWKPTILDHFWGQPPRPSSSEVESLQVKLQRYSKAVLAVPYDAKSYSNRASVLLKLGYPELAAADAYKSLILYNAGLDESDSPDLGEKVRIHYGMMEWFDNQNMELWKQQGDLDLVRLTIRLIHERYMNDERKQVYMLMLSCLQAMRAYPDRIKICKEALEKYRRDPYFTEALKSFKSEEQRVKAQATDAGASLETLDWGWTLSNIYPWVPTEMCTRERKTIMAANKSLKLCSDNLEIRSSDFRAKISDGQSFGMFAKKDIQIGQKVLDCRTAFGVSTRETAGHCYNCSQVLHPSTAKSVSCCPRMKFCSKECFDIAESNYHRVLCGRDFDDIVSQSDKDQECNARMYLRLLAIGVQSGEHLLKHPLIRCLTPVPSDHGIPFGLQLNVITPIRILERLGMDAFDEKYDIWILRTAFNRIRNNSCSSKEPHFTTRSINPMYSFLNHSCDPDVSPLHYDPFFEKLLYASKGSCDPDLLADHDISSRQILLADRNIKKGEEVFTTYIGDVEDMPREERWRALEPWVGKGGCKCKKCESGK